MAPLGKPEFHLNGHELPPETDYRREAAEVLNRRPNCLAVLTRKRSLENHLHPQAISAAGGIEVSFSDFEHVAEITARAFYRQRPESASMPWELLGRRARQRMANRAKRWLNTVAADHMTVDLLAERDPDGEVMSWLAAISRLTE